MHVRVDPPVDTLLAVAVGAVLATLGGLLATQMERTLHRRERERSAALLFGELLTALRTILNIADQARGRGEPFGPFTLRLLRAARRELDAYERTRAALYDLREGRLRLEIHVLMVRVGLSIDGVFETTARVGQAGAELATHPADAALRAEIEQLRRDQAAAFDFALESVRGSDLLLKRLETIGKVNFEDLEPLAGNPYADAGSVAASPTLAPEEASTPAEFAADERRSTQPSRTTSL